MIFLVKIKIMIMIIKINIEIIMILIMIIKIIVKLIIHKKILTIEMLITIGGALAVQAHELTPGTSKHLFQA